MSRKVCWNCTCCSSIRRLCKGGLATNAKKKLYVILLAVSLGFVTVAFLLRNAGLPYRVNAALSGMATTLSCVSLPRLLSLWSESTSPSEARRNRIEASDERNAALRNRAGALSGNLLQWSLLALLWLSVGLNAPLWVPVLFGCLFAAKALLEALLLCRFQKEM